MDDLLDTNIVSELRKPVPSPAVLRFLRKGLRRRFISTVTIAEIEFGIHMAHDLAKATPSKLGLRKRIDRSLSITPWKSQKRSSFAGDALSMQVKRRAELFPQPDALLAATALEHNLTLVTRNTRDFAGIPRVSFFNPWEQTL